MEKVNHFASPIVVSLPLSPLPFVLFYFKPMAEG